MKATSFAARLICLLQILCLLFLLCACPGGTPTPPAGGDTPGDGGTTPETPGENPGGVEPEPLPEPNPYPPNGVEGTGIDNIPSDVRADYAPVTLGSLSAGECEADIATGGSYPGGATLGGNVFPLVGRSVEGEVTVTSKELTALFRTGKLEAKLYRLVDAAGFSFERAAAQTYDGGGAVILASVPLSLKSCRDVSLTNFSWINVSGTALEMTDCTSLSFVGMELIGENALQAHTPIADLTVTGCRMIGRQNGLTAEVESATVLDSVFAAGGAALSLSGVDAYVENCLINAPHERGVLITADDSRLSGSTVRGSVTAGATNLLLDGNLIYGTPVSLILRDACNAVALLNLMLGVTVDASHSVYLSDNHLNFNLVVQNSDYVLADGNHLTDKAGVSLTGTTHESGSNLTDTSARAEAGALDSLLPQVDRELFVGMARKETVREREQSDRRVVPFLREESRASNVIIVPPGAYSTDAMLVFDKKTVPGATVYAYGVLLERENYGGTNLYVEEADHLTIKGIAFGHPMNSSGNAVLIAKRDGCYIDLIAGAGMLPNWTDTKYYSFTGLTQTIYGYRPGHPEPYADMGTQERRYDKTTGIMTLKVSAAVYAMMEVGDTITCRGAGATAIQSTRADTLSLTDVTVYGAAGFALNDTQSMGDGIHLTRLWVTTAAAPIVDQETYEHYRALETQYGVSFGVCIDELGRTRGTPHKMSSVDATHSSHSKKGITAVSCLFESMCDDGTNQCSAHARMAGWTDLGDGKMELHFKTNISSIGLSNGWGGGTCILYAKGERVYLYRTDGLLVCDTEALSDARTLYTQKNEYGMEDTFYAVTIDKADFNFSAVEGVDLDTAAPSVLKVCVDNRSWQSDGFLFDNCKVQNIRSRGLLLKASNGTVKHCSIISTGMAAINIGAETEWGESGISQNVKLLNNYIENSGHYGNQPKNSSIYIHGLGMKVSNEPYLNLKGIEISGNRIVDRRTSYALFVSGAADLSIHHNDFGTRKGHENESLAPLRFESVRAVTLSDNVYPAACSEPTNRLSAYLYDQVSGNDIEGFPPDIMVSDAVDSFIDYQPTWDKAGKVSYHGNWKVGYVNRSDGSGFTPYTTFLQDVGWLCAGANTIWGNKGGLWVTTGFSYAAQQNYNVVITYTAPESGYYRLHVATYTAPGGDGISDGLYAVIKNNREFIWPAGGNGNYNDDSNYYRVSGETELGFLQEAFADLTVYLEKGDVLYFTARRLGTQGWSRFGIVPIVIRPEKDEE